MSVIIRQRAALLALFATSLFGAFLPARVQAQAPAPPRKTKTLPEIKPGSLPQPRLFPAPKGAPSDTSAPLDPTQLGRAMVPLKRYPMVGNSTFIPKDIPIRSLKGVTGFEKVGSKTPTRVQVGGTNGASVIEKTVNMTLTDTVDERTPFWSADEQYLFYAGNSAANAGRYGLYRLSSGVPSDDGQKSATALTDPAGTQYDYYFPAVNTNGTRVAFLRSSDGKGIDDPTKQWNLCVSFLPANGTFIETDPLGPNDLKKLTEGRDFPNGTGGRAAFTNVGRPAWIGSSTLVFAAQLAGDPNYHVFTVDIQTLVIFQLTAGGADERNPSVSPDGRWIAFDSNAASNTTGGTYIQGKIRTETDPNAAPASAPGPGANRNIFTMTTLGQNVKQFTLQFAGAPVVNSYQPAWTSSQNNNFTNPNGTFFYIGFASDRIPQFDASDTEQRNITGFATGPPDTSSVYYVISSTNGGNTINAESAPSSNVFGGGANRIDTANDTLVNGILNDVTKPQYRDQYPAFAPFIKVFRVSFQSNRNGTYNANSFGNGFTKTPLNLNNIFIASLIDITAPTLLRYDTSTPTGEVVHINPVTDDKHPYNAGSSVRNRADGITPGATLHFAVRMEDREAGLRPENSLDGGAVFLQFKNPNSKYQSLDQGGGGVEHKEFRHFGGETDIINIVNNAPIHWHNNAPGVNYFVGNEFEAQAISAADRTTYFRHRGNTQGGGTLYVPSSDDAGAFQGNAIPPLDGGTYPSRFGGTVTTANVWLRLKPLVELNADGTPVLDGNGNQIPIKPADGKGGVLYGAAWQVPDESSDWYIDVIAYDNAINPFAPTQHSNAIIYDNVWGFSTAPPISGQPTDILVVADYTLGQKFFSSRFGSQPTGNSTSNNLVPIFWGAESYFTDRDQSLFPSEQTPNQAEADSPTATTFPFWRSGGGVNEPTPFWLTVTTAPGGVGGGPDLNRSGSPNTLGVASYNDEILDSGATTSVDGYRLPPTGRYSIWRVLSRGPVPAAVLQDYLPQVANAPADTAKNEDPANPRKVLNVNRMIVWASPFSGDMFVGTGTITDVTTQNDLAGFVQAGGRLFISGQDIGFALVGNGQANSFFNNVLKATYLRDNVGTTSSLTGAAVGTYTGQLTQDSWNPNTANHAYGTVSGTNPLNRPYNGPNSGALRYANLYGGDIPNIRSSGSLTAFGNDQAVDVIQPNPTAGSTPADSVDVFLYGGGGTGSAIIASSSQAGVSPVGDPVPYDPTKGFLPVGRVAYSAAGFESIENDFYTFSGQGMPAPTIRAMHARRAEIMHNITCAFRTGTLTGQAIDQDGRPVKNALVRAIFNVADDTQPAAGTALTDDSGNFQIVGLQAGFYVCFGYKPGFYTQHNTGNTLHGGWRASTNLVLKSAGPGALTGIKNDQTGSRGGVYNTDGTQTLGNIQIQLIGEEPNGSLTLIKTFSAKVGDPLPVGAYEFPSLAIGQYIVLVNSKLTVAPDDPTHIKSIDTGPNAPLINPIYGDVVVGLSPANTYRLGPNTVVLPGDPNSTNDFGKYPKIQISEGITAQIDYLLPAKPQQVKGRVFDQDSGAGIKDAIVTATTAANTATTVASATTDENGNYTLVASTPQFSDPTQLPGGTYIVTATANGYSTAVPPSAVNAVTVVVGGSTDPSVTAPDIKLKKLPPGSVSGLVSRFIGTGKPTTSGVEGATVTFYAVTTVGGQQVQAPNPSFTVTVSATPTTAADGYVFNYSKDAVDPGTYNAYVAKSGLTGDPSPFANITVTTGQETRNVNFTLQPPKVYGAGIQLASVPQDYSSIPTADIFGLSPTADNDGNGTSGDANDQAIYNQFNVADWTGDQYNISPTIPLRLGKGYFIRFAAVAAVAKPGTPLTTSSYTINLGAGWNLIGHPFSNQSSPNDPAADIDISSSQLASFSYTINGATKSGVPLSQAVADNAVQGVAFSYSGSNAGSTYIPGTLLKPWFGYWFRAFVPVQLTLQYPGAASRALKASLQSGGKFQTVTRAMREQIVHRAIESKGPTDWRMQIAARQGDLVDTDNTIGVAPDAHEGFDNKYDNEKPPMVTEAPALYLALQGTNAAGRAASFSDSLTAPGGGTKSWDFTVQTTGTGDVTIYWPNINRLPRGIEPILVDTGNGKRIAMRSGSSSYRFTPGGRAEHAFRIEVAPATSMPLDILNLRTDSRALGGSYRFSFTVTRAVDVNAEIRTLTGRSMRRFQSRAAGGTQSAVVWDGRDQAGNRVPPGPYLLSVTARDERGAQVTRSVTVMMLE